MARKRAALLSTEAYRETLQSYEAARRSSNYAFLTVMFAGSLMFVGLATLFSQRSVRTAVIGLATLVLVAGLVWLVTLPLRFDL